MRQPIKDLEPLLTNTLWLCTMSYPKEIQIESAMLEDIAENKFTQRYSFQLVLNIVHD